MSTVRRKLKYWSIWTLTASLLMIANPWTEFGAMELIAVLGPFVLAVPGRVYREPTLAIGLPVLTLMWLADPVSTTVLRLVFAWAVFAGGVVLAARVLESQKELESVVGLVAYSDAEPAGETHRAEQLRGMIDREVGRARRHDRCFAVLSAAAHPGAVETDAVGLKRSELLHSLAENRARLELKALLREELHVYCDVAIEGARVLALVPEIDPDALELLLERLRNAADETSAFGIQIGAASFPRDAVCVDDLIDAADRARQTSKLRSIPEHKIAGQRAAIRRQPDDGARRSPDVKA